MKQLRSRIWPTAFHIWLNNCAFPHILGSLSSYMTLQLLHSEFLHIWGKIVFFFISVYLLAGSVRTEPILTTEKQAWFSLLIFILWLLHKMKDLLHEERSGSWANIRNNTLIEKPKPFVKLPRSGDQKQSMKKRVRIQTISHIVHIQHMLDHILGMTKSLFHHLFNVKNTLSFCAHNKCYQKTSVTLLW